MAGLTQLNSVASFAESSAFAADIAASDCLSIRVLRKPEGAAMNSRAQYHPICDYVLKSIDSDGAIASLATYYLRGKELYLSEQLRLHDPADRFHGDPDGRVEITTCSRLRVMAALSQVGELEAGIFINSAGQCIHLSAIQL